MPAETGCIADDISQPPGCTDARGMRDIGQIAISPDGRNLYVPSRGRSSIAVFDRDAASGVVSQKPGVLGCYTSDSAVATQDNCTLVGGGLNGAFVVAVSPDGSHVYVGGTGGAPATFTRTASGDLAYVGTGTLLGGEMRGITVSPDGASVYTSMINQPGGLIGVYQIDPGGSGLTYRQCWASVSTAYGCVLTTDGYVDEPGELVVTPDNKELLLANGENTGTDYSQGSIVGFGRSTSGPSQGDLTAPSIATCVSDGSLASCQARAQQSYLRGLAIADGGTRIYAAGAYGLFRVDRDPVTGALSPLPSQSACVSYETNPYNCGSLGVPATAAIPTRALTVPPDGENVYLGTESPTPGVFSLSRSADGSLSSVDPPLRCLNLDGSSSCGALRGGTDIRSMVSSPQGRFVYAAGGNRLFAFSREAPPAANSGPTSGGPVEKTDKTPPHASLAVPKQRLGKVVKSGKLLIKVKTDEAGSISAQAVFAGSLGVPANGKAFRAKAKQTIVATGKKAVSRAGTYAVTLKLTKKAQKKFGKLKKVVLGLSVRVADRSGNRRQLKKTVTLKR